MYGWMDGWVVIVLCNVRYGLLDVGSMGYVSYVCIMEWDYRQLFDSSHTLDDEKEGREKNR